MRALTTYWISCSGLLFATSARAQETTTTATTREPLCVEVESRRLASGPWLGANGSDRIVAAPFAVEAPDGARFVVVSRDPEHTLRDSDASAPSRTLDELGWSTPAPALTGTGGLAFVRVRRDLGVAGGTQFVADPVEMPRPANEETRSPGIPVAVTLAGGVLVLEQLAGDVYGTVVPSAGAIPVAHRIAAAPAAERPDSPRGFVWLTATARGDGAIALAGTEDGFVTSMQFDRTGALVGTPASWGETRVGGPMELLPIAEGPAAALLARPVRGTGPQNEQARVQVIVALHDDLTPLGEPVNTGFAQFPMATAMRRNTLVLAQWVQQQGMAIAQMPVTSRRITEQLPRLWYSQPPLEGLPFGHAATVDRDGVLYDVSAYVERDGGVHGHLVWLPPSGTPIVRRDVLALRARLVSPPVVLPADDGVVVVAATYDETGGALDAFHVRCELVSVPAHPDADTAP